MYVFSSHNIYNNNICITTSIVLRDRLTVSLEGSSNGALQEFLVIGLLPLEITEEGKRIEKRKEGERKKRIRHIGLIVAFLRNSIDYFS